MKIVGKALVNVIFKDGQVMPMQVDNYDYNKFATEYHAFENMQGIMHKIDEIKLVKFF
jgi:hypothetical protein